LDPPGVKRSAFLIPAIALGVLAVAACAYFAIIKKPDGEQPKPGGGKSNMETASKAIFREDGMLNFLNPEGARIASITVEVAETEQARIQGMMGRTSMRSDRGMLFVFEEEEERAFWMANTPLPLDIIFVGENMEIVKIHRNAVPFSEESLPSGKPAKYVVEVNGGFANRSGIMEGDRISWLKK
jgi:uncharacterized protein